MGKTTRKYMRLIHRYLGFFLIGIMAVYSLSGITLIFRKTDLLKKEVIKELQLKPNLSAQELGKEIKIRDLKIETKQEDIFYFQQGEYNTKSGMTVYTTKETPFFIGKMEHLHKANTNSPIYFFNIFFGASLLFFVVSTFWMFIPKSSIFKKGLYFSLAGLVLTLILLFV